MLVHTAAAELYQPAGAVLHQPHALHAADQPSSAAAGQYRRSTILTKFRGPNEVPVGPSWHELMVQIRGTP
jgi:hypothetical protein